MKRRTACIALAAMGLAGHDLTLAQAYPDKPLKLIVPYPPGASTDALARVVAQKLSSSMGQPVVVDNRGGASGNIGAEATARSAPDGYTFMLGTDSTHAANAHMMINAPNPIRDFTPLSLAVMNPVVLVVHSSVPARNVSELIAWLKANPSKGSFGSSGNGSPHHLAGELLKTKTGAPLVHVPYRGGGPALNDALGGQILILFTSAITAMPHIQSGKLRAIGVTGATRYAGLSDVPTIAETIPGFDVISWLAFFGPAKMQPAATKRLSDELMKALKESDVKEKMEAAGLVVVAGGPDQLAALQHKDYEFKGGLIRSAGIKPE